MAQQNDYPSQDDIAALAQKFWEEEGQPEGKAEEHWQRAEEQLRQSKHSDVQAQPQAA
jgi:F0F1-type ATP synthase epsilon subunit